jgi:hypothetical protein
MKQPLPPLSAELQQLLRFEQERPPLPEAIKASVAASLETVLEGWRSVHEGSTSPHPPEAMPEVALPPAANGSVISAGVSGTLSSGVRMSWLYLASALTAAFLVGGALGASLRPWGEPTPSRPQSESLPAIPAPSLRSPATTPTSPSAARGSADEARVRGEEANTRAPSPAKKAVSSASNELPRRATEAATGAPARDERRLDSRDTRLAEERALIDAAQSALARGDAASALKLLLRHEKEFSTGRLTEERAALTVQALASAGRLVEAGERAARFRLRYPNSLLLTRVNAAVGAGPIR